jgi:cytosine/uracil/thiamine/allantoin permease
LGSLVSFVGYKPIQKGDKTMKTTKIVKFVTVNGCKVPVYAAQEKSMNLNINAKRIVAGVIFGSMLVAVSAIAQMI